MAPRFVFSSRSEEEPSACAAHYRQGRKASPRSSRRFLAFPPQRTAARIATRLMSSGRLAAHSLMWERPPAHGVEASSQGYAFSAFGPGAPERWTRPNVHLSVKSSGLDDRSGIDQWSTINLRFAAGLSAAALRDGVLECANHEDASSLTGKIMAMGNKSM